MQIRFFRCHKRCGCPDNLKGRNKRKVNLTQTLSSDEPETFPFPTGAECPGERVSSLLPTYLFSFSLALPLEEEKTISSHVFAPSKSSLHATNVVNMRVGAAGGKPKWEVVLLQNLMRK